jgi:hypothetical protein
MMNTAQTVNDVINELKTQLHRIDSISKMTYLGAYKEEDDGADKTVGQIHLTDIANLMEVITTLSSKAYDCIDRIDTQLGSDIRCMQMKV